MALTKVKLIADGTIVQSNLHASHGITTADIGENASYLYYTDARARAAVSVSGNALSYNSSTGVITSNFEESPTFTGNVVISGTLDVSGITTFSTDVHVGGASAARFKSDGTNTIVDAIPNPSAIVFRNSGAVEKMRLDSSGNLGIGTTSPSQKLHVQNGYLLVDTNSAVGSGIWMPDINGNPSLRIVTDQATGSYTSILNAWGNSSNTGVMLGTVRNDGIAFQVRSGVTLTSGFANDDGSTRFIVKGDGNVGIGTSSPSKKLEVHGTSGNSGVAIFKAQGASTDAIIDIESERDVYLRFKPANTNKWAIIADYPAAGDFDIYNYPNNFNSMIFKDNKDITTNMAGGNFGIGTTSPAKKLTVNAGTTSGDGISITGSSSPAIYINETSGTVNSSFQNDGAGSYLGTSTSHPMIFRTANTERMRITSGGNVGINGTSNFGSSNKAIQLINGVYSGAFQIDSVGNIGLAQNAYQDGTWKYYQTNEAAILNLEDGQFKFFNAASGTANTVISFTQRMRITSGGYILTGARTSPTSGWGGGSIEAERGVGAFNGDKTIYLFNNGTDIKLDAYDYGINAPLDITIAQNGGNVGIATTSPDTKLDVHGTTGTKNTTTLNSNTSSVYETSLYFTAGVSATSNHYITTTSVFPPMASGGYILVEVVASGYGSAGSNGFVFKYIAGGYGGHYNIPASYHPTEIIADTHTGNCDVAIYYPNSTTIGITVTNNQPTYSITGVMRVKITTTYG